MIRQNILGAGRLASLIVVLLTSAGAALAGGFYISVEAPGDATSTGAKDVVMVVRPYGCHQPSDAALKATAEGIVDGKRQSVPLELTLTEKGVYAVKRQWPANKGVWVVAVTGTYMNATSSALVSSTAKKEGRQLAVLRTERRALNAAEVDDALRSLASGASQTSRATK